MTEAQQSPLFEIGDRPTPYHRSRRIPKVRTKRQESERQRAAGRYAQWRQWRNRAKEAIGCQVCGETCPACLDFHHVDPDSKSFHVSSNVTCSHKRLLKEIAKCALICGNCHRKITYGYLEVELHPIDPQEYDALKAHP